MGEEEKKQTEEKKEEREEPTKKAEEDKKTTDEEHVPIINSSPPNCENKKNAAPVDESNGKKEDSSGGDAILPPQEIILKVYMHCEGCARKVRRCLKGFEGVDDVVTDTKAHTVVVKGEKADPLKVLQRVQDKINHRQVELLSPTPEIAIAIAATQVPKEIVNPPPPPPSQKKEVITVMLKVHMHCEACAQEIRRRIQKMQGVESATADLKTSEAVVKGTFEPPKLVDFIRKRTGKHALILKVEPSEEEKAKETTTEQEKKDDTKGDQGKKDDAGEGEGEGECEGEGNEEEGENQDPKVELKKSELLYNYPQYYQYQQFNHQSLIHHELNAYPPQMFSDENPNSCSVM